MPHINDMKTSKYLTKEDCGPKGLLVTIKGCFQANVARQGAPQEMKWCLVVHEHEKPMVLNMTNIASIAAITGADTTEGWIGHKIVLFNDPTVTNGPKVTGGIRVRAPRQQAAPPAARPAPAPARRPAPPAPAAEDYGPDDEGDANEDIPY